jgi:hypothetical protein
MSEEATTTEGRALPTAPAPSSAETLTGWAIQCLRPEVRAPNGVEAVDLAYEVYEAAYNKLNPPPP